MSWFPARIPPLVQALYPHRIWRMPDQENTVYPTFDDGPHPDITPWVLETLARYDAKATFFVVGRNAEAHPGIMARIREEGHAVGNHTWAHENGRHTATGAYLESVARCQRLTGTRLYRPPYGRLSGGQARALRKDYDLVMWDVLSGDHDEERSPERCLRDVLRCACPGSIVVFHDSEKAAPRLMGALPAALEAWKRKGLRMAAMPALRAAT